ncbi:ribonuclease H-like domain-containing protein [Tanacetum coccineum]
MVHDDPWNSYFLNKWPSSVSLLKEELSYVPVWVRFHDVPLVAYTLDGLSLMATKFGTPMMLDFDHLEMVFPNLEVKKKKSGGNNGGTKNFTFLLKPKTQYRLKAKQSTNGMSNSPKMTPFVGTNKASTLGKLVLVDDDGKPINKVDYPINLSSDDDVEPFVNEMASFLASKSTGVVYGPKSLLEQWRESNVDDDYDPYDDDMYED